MDTQAEDIAVDVVVLGGGMAGLSAAGYAASRGTSVCLVEKGPELGGSALLSGGWVWTVATYEELRERAPNGDPALQRAFLERYRPAIEWIRRSGVETGEERVCPPGFGRGYHIDILTYFKRCEALVGAAGGLVLRGATADRLLVEDGAVGGAVVRDAAGVASVRASAVVIATGGFQGNPSRLYGIFGENARQLLLRANPHSTGDGIRLGIEAGADLAGDPRTFYGHLVAWPLETFGPKEFQRYSVGVLSMTGILVNLAGERFADESPGSQAGAIATAQQPQARAAVLVDDAGRLRAAGTTLLGEPGIDKVDEARRAGARVASAATLAELAGALAAWGFDGRRALATVAAFNELVRTGTAAGQPPRRWQRDPIADGPFHAVEARPGITATQSGLRTDVHARVLDRAGRPIPGLYAAGADAGGFYSGGYAGSLSVGCVFGLSAVEAILGPALFSGPAPGIG